MIANKTIRSNGSYKGRTESADSAEELFENENIVEADNDCRDKNMLSTKGLKWSRVFCSDDNSFQLPGVFDLTEDLEIDERIWSDIDSDEDRTNNLLFDPRHFDAENHPLVVKEYILKEEELQEYAK